MDIIFNLLTAPFEIIASLLGNSVECMVGCTFLALISCCLLSVVAWMTIL